jgi:TnpA family transposase
MATVATLAESGKLPDVNLAEGDLKITPLRAVTPPEAESLMAVALREIGRIERTLFTLDWLKNIDLRRRANAGLNKGEAHNALARAIFFYRLGEMRDRSFESQVYRASGLNLLIAAIILWNTRYLEQTFC